MGGAKPSVTLTFAGDSDKLTKAMGEVGKASEDMGRRVASTSDDMHKAGRSADDLAEKTDTLDTRAMGYRDTITGVTDSYRGLTDSSKSLEERMLLLGMGIGDFASGLTNLVIPALANTKVGQLAISASTKAWAAAQQLLNLSFWASPIGLMIIAVAALVAIIVVIAVKTDWFQRLWAWAWAGIKASAVAVWDWLKELPEKLGSSWSRIGTLLSAPFRVAFNFISDAWNNTIGRLSWTVPGWVPIVGGNSISAPRLPKFHTGGMVPGPPGREMLAVLEGGEEVVPRTKTGSRQLVMTFAGDVDSALASAIKYLFRTGQITIEELAA
jgi:uncharacterized protein YoxC